MYASTSTGYAAHRFGDCARTSSPHFFPVPKSRRALASAPMPVIASRLPFSAGRASSERFSAFSALGNQPESAERRARSTYAAPRTAHEASSSGCAATHFSRSATSAARSTAAAGAPMPTAAAARSLGPGGRASSPPRAGRISRAPAIRTTAIAAATRVFRPVKVTGGAGVCDASSNRSIRSMGSLCVNMKSSPRCPKPVAAVFTRMAPAVTLAPWMTISSHVCAHACCKDSPPRPCSPILR